MLRSSVVKLLSLPLLALLILVMAPATDAPAFTTSVKVTLIVRSMTALDNELESDTDLYVRAGIGLDPSIESSFGQIVVDEDHVDANDPGWANGWSMSRVVGANTEQIEVRMQGWDNDNCDNPACEGESPIDPDDKGDVSPEDGRDYSEFFNLYSSDIADDGFTSKCIEGNESGKIRVCFDLQIFDPGPDSDGDGLLDSWETEGQGLDVDRDGTIDLDLYAMGARPDRKDAFLELDWDPGHQPSRESIQAMKKAFAVQNISLWVDTGSLVDPTAREGQIPGTCVDGINNNQASDALLGQFDQTDPDCIGLAPRRYLETSVEDPLPGNCTDGMDNDGDMLADSQDPDCLVGDNLGGGAQGAGPTNACGTSDPNFYTVKSFRFDIQRRWVFRYAIASFLPPRCLDTTMPPDGVADINPWGGQGEIGGNDFMDFNHDGGTIMHEFGHTLGLRHGGDTDANCSPPYVSIMNYDNQGGINRRGGGFILDYGPPRIALDGSTRGIIPQPIQETELDEDYVMDSTDNANMFVFADEPFGSMPPGTKRTRNMDTPVDWNNDGDFDERGFDSNVNTGTPNPRSCLNNVVSSADLKGHNDWNAIVLNPRKFDDDKDQMLGDTEELPPTLEELNIATQQAIDMIAPTVAFITTPADPTNDPNAPFSFVGTDNPGGTGVASYECRLDGGAWSACTSPHVPTIVAPPDGFHTFEVRAIDAATNVGDPASYTWLLDVTKPVIAGIVTEYTINGPIQYSVLEEPDRWALNSVTVEFACFDPANTVASGVASSGSLPGRKTLTNDGRYAIASYLSAKAKCTDNAGNSADNGANSLKVNVDRHAPTCAVTPPVQYVPANSGQTHARSVSVSGQDGNLPAAALKFELLSVTGLGTTTGWVIGSETPALDTSGRFEGRPNAVYDITYEVQDPAGWTSTCGAKVKTSN